MRYHEEEALKRLEQGGVSEEGIAEAFTLLANFSEEIINGKWITGDVFVFTNKGILNYLIGDKIINHAVIDKKMFILGYIPQINRIFLINKSLKITSYELLSQMLMFQRTVVNRDPDKTLISSIPEIHHSKIAKFLESEGFAELAFEVTPDAEHKFELALTLNLIERAYEIAERAADSKEKYR